MSLFGYYASHAFVNQIRKLFKTWVFIFIIACFGIGMLVGFIGSKLSDINDAKNDSAITEEAENTGDNAGGADDLTSLDSIGENDAEQIEYVQYAGRTVSKKFAITELIIFGVVTGLFIFFLLGAQKQGSAIFLPADVNLLFSSPLKPQSVLMFRLSMQVGLLIFLTIYMLLELPTLIHLVGMNTFQAISVIAIWGLLLITSLLVQVGIYSLCSVKPFLKANLNKIVYGIAIAATAGFAAFYMTSGLPVLDAAFAYFNSNVVLFIPVIGWLKAIFVFAEEGKVLYSVLVMLGMVAVQGLIIFGIQKIKPDFYEDAMAKSEEMAALMEARNKGKFTARSSEKADRSEKLLRDGLKHGRGANVLFFKTMYNRYRFATLHFFTKTSIMYIVIAVVLSILSVFVFEEKNIVILILALGVAVFYRSIGSPLSQDTETDSFKMIPESSWDKLLWSILGGLANTALDILPALIIGAIFIGCKPSLFIVWVLFLLSLDLYSTNTGAFIKLSVPTSAGANLKMMVQIMFIYFGLIPDVLLIVFGTVLNFQVLAIVLAAVINLILSAIFFALTPLFLERGQK